MTFTDYRTAARMRDVIAEVAGDVIDRKRPGYRYATVDNIDEVKNRANVTFAGELTAVPIRMGAIRPTAGALVRVRGKHGDLHVEDVVTGDISLVNALHFANGDTGFLGYSDDPDTGGFKIANKDDQAHSWMPFRDGSFYFSSRADLGSGHWIFRSWNGSSYTERFRIEVDGKAFFTGDIDFANNALIASNAGTTNIDHFWHNDGDNKWHFVSDGSYKQVGNSWVRAGNFEVPHGGKFTNEAELAGMFVNRDGTRDYVVLYANDDIDFANNLLANVAFRVRPNAGQILNLVETRFYGDIYISGSTLFLWTSAGRAVLENVNEIRGDDGADTDPTYTFGSANQTGFYLNGGHMSFSYNATRIFHVSGGIITGIGDNTHLLGNSSNRWKAVWAVDGTINTSDMSEKEEVIDSDLGLQFIRNMRPRRWRWRGGIRPHYGLAAQEVKQAIDAMGQDFAGFIDPAVTFMEDEYTEGVFEEPGALGLRYHEFIGPIIKAIQELADRMDALEGSPSG